MNHKSRLYELLAVFEVREKQTEIEVVWQQWWQMWFLCENQSRSANLNIYIDLKDMAKG